MLKPAPCHRKNLNTPTFCTFFVTFVGVEDVVTTSWLIGHHVQSVLGVPFRGRPSTQWSKFKSYENCISQIMVPRYLLELKINIALVLRCSITTFDILKCYDGLLYQDSLLIFNATLIKTSIHLCATNVLSILFWTPPRTLIQILCILTN